MLLFRNQIEKERDLEFDINFGKFKGLTSIEAKEKLRTEGFNNLPSSKPKNFISIALGVVKEPMFILLVACGTLYLVMGDLQEVVTGDAQKCLLSVVDISTLKKHSKH